MRQAKSAQYEVLQDAYSTARKQADDDAARVGEAQAALEALQARLDVARLYPHPRSTLPLFPYSHLRGSSGGRPIVLSIARSV